MSIGLAYFAATPASNVSEFGGLEHLSWIVTAYMLATAAVTPFYGENWDYRVRELFDQPALYKSAATAD